MISSLRVLDESAFTELTGKLDALIARAATSGRELNELFKRAEGLNEHAELAKAELDKRLVLSARILQVTKDQLDHVEQAVKALTDRQARIDMLSAKVDAQLGEFHAHMGKAVEQVGQSVGRAVEGLDAQQQAGLQSRERADQLLATATDLTERFADLQARMASGTDRFEQGLARVLAEMDRSASQADRTSSKLDEQVYALKARITAFTDGIEQWLQPAFDEITVIRHDADDTRRDLRGHIGELGRRLDDAVQRLDARIEAGLADLGRRQETAGPSADAMKAEMAELATRISASVEGRLQDFHARLDEERAQVEAAVNRIEQHLSPVLSELAARAEGTDAARAEMREHTAALKNQLTAAVANLEAQFTTALGRLQEQLSAARAEIGDRAKQDQEQAARLDQELHELHARLSSVVGQVDERLSTALSDLAGAASKDDAGVSRLEGQLADVRAELGAISTQVQQRIADTLSRLEGQSADAGAEAAARLSALAAGHEQLSSAVVRLEERLVSALDELGDASAQDNAQASRLEGQLADVQAQLGAISTQVEQRLAGTLSRLEGQSADADAEAASRLTALADGQERLKSAVARLDECLSGALTELGNAPSGELEHLARLEDQLADVKAELAALPDKVDGQVADAVAGLESRRVDANADVAARLEDQLADVKAELAALPDKVDGRVADAVAGLENRRVDANADVAARLEELSGSHDQHGRSIGRAIGRLEQQIAATLERLTDGDPEADDQAAVWEDRLGDLKAQVVAVCDRLDHDVTPALAALPRSDDAAETTRRLAEIAAHHAQLAASVDRLEDRLLDAVREVRDTTGHDDERQVGLEAGLEQLRAELRAVLDRVDERIDRAVDGLEQRGTSNSADIAARLEALAGGQDEHARSLGRAVAQLEQQITSALAGPAAGGTRGDERASNVAEELNRLRAQLGTGFSQLDERVADALAGVQEQGVGQGDDVSADVAARLDDMAAGHEQLSGAVARLQEQITSALAELTAAAPPPAAEALSDKVDQQLGQLRAQVSTIFNQLDERIAEVLAGLPGPGGASGEDGEAAAPAGADVQAELSELQEQLGSAVARLEAQVSSVRTDLTRKTTKTHEQTERLEQHLADVKELLSGVAVRMDNELDRPARTGGGGGLDIAQGMAALREHLDGQIAALARSHEQIEEIVERFERKMATIADRPADGGESGGGAAIEALREHVDEQLSRLTDSHAQMERVFGSLQEQVSAALAGGAEGGAPADADGPRGLADLQQQLGSAVARLESQISAMRTEATREAKKTHDDGAAAQLSALASSQEQLNAAVGRLEDRLSAALVGIATSETSMETASGSTVERELALVAERLAALGAKMENDVEPVLAALQQREPDDGLERTLADLRAQLGAITEHVDQRVSAAITQVAGRPASAGGGTAVTTPAPAPAPAKKPVSRKKLPPNELVAALIDALNTGDARVIREFVAAQYSDSALQERQVKDRVDVYMSFHDESGEVIVCDVDTSNKEQVVAIVQETDSPQRHRFVVMLDPTPPHKIYVVNIDAL